MQVYCVKKIIVPLLCALDVNVLIGSVSIISSWITISDGGGGQALEGSAVGVGSSDKIEGGSPRARNLEEEKKKRRREESGKEKQKVSPPGGGRDRPDSGEAHR